jgi:hypothetical protein
MVASTYSVHEVKGREPGIYLDEVEREQAEELRARLEEREPNFEDPLPANAGTPVVTQAQAVAIANLRGEPQSDPIGEIPDHVLEEGATYNDDGTVDDSNVVQPQVQQETDNNGNLTETKRKSRSKGKNK